MGVKGEIPRLKDVHNLVMDAYVPFADIERAVPWPTALGKRAENDAEHSFALGFIGGAIAEQLGLDTGKVAEFALVHDFAERITGDVSVWDVEGRNGKEEQEAIAMLEIKERWGHFPWIHQRLEEYSALESEEACFVYALDKLLPYIMIADTGGYFWKQNNITYEDLVVKKEEIRPRIAKHPVVLDWYDQELKLIEEQKEKLFTPEVIAD